MRSRNKRIPNKLDWSSPWSRPRSFVFYGSTYPSEGRDQYPFPFRRVLLGIEIVKVIARVHRVHATPKFNNNTTIKTQSTTTTTATTPLLLLLLHDDGRLFQIHTHTYTAHSLGPINLCNQVHIFQFFLMSVLYATCVTQCENYKEISYENQLSDAILTTRTFLGSTDLKLKFWSTNLLITNFRWVLDIVRCVHTTLQQKSYIYKQNRSNESTEYYATLCLRGKISLRVWLH